MADFFILPVSPLLILDWVHKQSSGKITVWCSLCQAGSTMVLLGECIRGSILVIHQNKIIPASRSRLPQIWSLGLGPITRKCPMRCYEAGLHSGFIQFPAAVTSASIPQFDRIPPLCRNPFSHPSLRLFLKEQIMMASYSVAQLARPLHHLQIPWSCFIGNSPKTLWRLC